MRYEIGNLGALAFGVKNGIPEYLLESKVDAIALPNKVPP
jgi:hypothetical protein